MHEPRHHLTSFATPESIRAPAFPASLSGTPDQVGDYPRDIRSPPSSLRGASRRSNLQPSTRWDACWRLLRRSEEHTSELQSLMRISYAVFCLKKKKIDTNNQLDNQTKKK